MHYVCRRLFVSILLTGTILLSHNSAADAQTGNITYLGPDGGSFSVAGGGATTLDSGTLYITCEAYAAAGESWDTVEASLELNWPGGHAGPQLFYASTGGGNGSISANVPYGDEDEDVTCSLQVNSMSGLGSYSAGATYTIIPSAPSDLRIYDYGPLVWDFPGQGGGYHRDVIWQFYALNGGAYFASNNVRERYEVGAPGTIGNTCNVPGVATNPNPTTLLYGQYTDRYGVQSGASEGFLRNICQVNSTCLTLTMQYVQVEAGDGTKIGPEWPIHVNFYCENVYIYR